MVDGAHLVEEAGDLERPGDPEVGDLLGLATGDVLAAEQDLARGRREEAGQQVEQRGLAGAVGADERVDGALGDAEADVGDRAEAAELLGQLAGLEQGSCCGRAGVAGHRHLLVRLGATVGDPSRSAEP